MFAFLFLAVCIFIFWLCVDSWPMWQCALFSVFAGFVFVLFERLDGDFWTSLAMWFHNLM